MRIKLNGTVVDNDSAAIYRRWGYNNECCPEDIRQALEQCPENEELVFEINSGGGSVYAGFEMYSLLKGAKRETVCEIQSIAGSAASVIASGCDVVRMSPVGNIMIHRSSTWSAGNAQDMREAEQMLDTIDESILNAYEKKCRGKCDRETLRDLMEQETFMTAERAMEIGLADELLYQDEEQEEPDVAGGAMQDSRRKQCAADGQQLIRCAAAMGAGMQHVLTALPDINELLAKEAAERGEPANEMKPEPKGQDLVAVDINQPDDLPAVENGGTTMTLEELRAQAPDLLAQIQNDAAAAERERINAIDGIAMAGYEDLVTAAKETPGATAESVAMQIIARQKQQQQDYLQNRAEDAAEGHVNDVEATAAPKNEKTNADAVIDAAFAEVFGE